MHLIISKNAIKKTIFVILIKIKHKTFIGGAFVKKGWESLLHNIIDYSCIVMVYWSTFFWKSSF